MKSKFRAISLGSALILSALATQADEQLVVTGSKITQAELDESDPVSVLAKPDTIAFLKTGKLACKHGTTSVHFNSSTLFSLNGEMLDTSALLASLKSLAAAKKISCLQVVSFEYDRKTFDQLSDALVEPLKISLFWDKSEK